MDEQRLSEADDISQRLLETRVQNQEISARMDAELAALIAKSQAEGSKSLAALFTFIQLQNQRFATMERQDVILMESLEILREIIRELVQRVAYR